jgi:hypothetical protein
MKGNALLDDNNQVAATFLPSSQYKSLTSTPYNVLVTDNFLVCNSGAASVVLPSAVTMGQGKRFVIKSNISTLITITSSSGTMDGRTTFYLAVQNESVCFESDGTNWLIPFAYKTAPTPRAAVSSPTTQTPARNDMYYPVLFEEDDLTCGCVARKTFAVTINNSTPAKCTISATAHGMSIGAPVIFSGGSLPAGVTAGTVYYIATTNFGANSFEITDLAGYTSNAPASTIVTTASGSGTCKAAGRLYVNEAGVYEIILSSVVAAVDNTDTTLDLWFVQGTAADTAANTGGTTVTKSDTQVRTVTTGQRLVLAVAIMLNMAVGDFVKINCKTSVGTKISLLAVAAGTVDGVAMPAMPASIMTVKKISQA